MVCRYSAQVYARLFDKDGDASVNEIELDEIDLDDIQAPRPSLQGFGAGVGGQGATFAADGSDDDSLDDLDFTNDLDGGVGEVKPVPGPRSVRLSSTSSQLELDGFDGLATPPKSQVSEQQARDARKRAVKDPAPPRPSPPPGRPLGNFLLVRVFVNSSTATPRVGPR